MGLASVISSIGFTHYYIIVLCLVCAITDIKTGKIYNTITYPSIVVGIAYNAIFVDHGIPVLSLIGFAAGVVPFGVAAWRGWIGGGDAKLFGAVGALGGAFFLVDFIFNTFVLAGTYSLIVILLHIGNMIRKRSKKKAGWFPRGRHIRLGVFIFLGSILASLGISFIAYLQQGRSL